MKPLALTRPVLYFRATLFWIYFAASVVFMALVLLAVRPTSIRTRYRVGRLWNRSNIAWLKLSCGLDFHVRGRENIPTDGEPVIFMAKHQSTWETIALATLLPVHTYVIKRELLSIPFFGWGIATMWPIAIDRSAGRKAVEQMIEQGRQRLAHGVSVLIFPEGTRTQPGKVSRYKMGGAILASGSGRRIVPIAHNAGEYWPRHSYFKWPGTIDVIIGEPIEVGDMSPEQINTRVQAWIESQMQQIRENSPEPPARH